MSNGADELNERLQRLEDGLAMYKRDMEYNLEVLGMKRAWQERGEDNVDSSHPIVFDIYIPPDTKEISRVYMRLRLKYFRSYSQTAAAGGGVYLTSNNTNTWQLVPAAPLLPDFMDITGAHTHGGAVASDGDHAHGMVSVSHDHDVVIPDHVHDIVRGIYGGTAASGVTVKINGIDRTSELGGPFNTDQGNLDITKYVTATGWNTVELVSSTLGRIHATIFVEIYLP